MVWVWGVVPAGVEVEEVAAHFWWGGFRDVE